MRTKLGFGVGDLGGNLFFTIMGFYLLYYLTDFTGLSAGLAGTALMIGKIWDAITDPAVGYLSDRTRSKMGRRRPFMLYGSFFLLITMILMFTNPKLSEHQIGLFAWATGAYCLLNTALTLVNIPYAALLPELTTDFNERTVLTGYRMAFAVVGTFLGAGLVLPIVNMFTRPETGWTLMGTVMGLVMLVTALITFFAIREPSHPEKPEKENLFKTYAAALKSRAFLTALFPWILHITGVTIIQGALLYFFQYIHEDEPMFQLALMALLAMTMICIPLWVAVSKRIGKKHSYNLGMGYVALVVLVFFIVGANTAPIVSVIIMGFAGIGFATHYVMPHAILPDVVEYDYSERGTRREGIYYGLWTLGSKLGQAFALALNGWVLALFGYVADVEQTSLARLGIRLLCGPIPAFFFVAGVIVLAFYPIDREFYQRILEKIKAHEGGD